MIKFFRKIRYSFMESGKTGKYFKYAIGEIVLVVIGILIALSINNWNEKRKEKRIIKDLLTNIRLDLQVDTLNFSRKLRLIPKAIKDNKFLLNTTELDSISADSLYKKLPFYTFVYKVKNQTFEKLTNSGITNFYEFNELLDEINTYYISDQNIYDTGINYDNDQNTNDVSTWLDMGVEIDGFIGGVDLDQIKTVQTEKTRRAIFIEQLNLVDMRNSLKMNTLRKKLLKNSLDKMKNRADKIIIMINEQLEK
jgi:hypothetical protein